MSKLGAVLKRPEGSGFVLVSPFAMLISLGFGLQFSITCGSQSMTYTNMQIMSRQVMAKKVVKAPSPMFSLRLTPDERKALDKAAAAEDRPSAYVARRAITDWLRERGFLK
jgi:hypothetical protein